SPIDAELSIMKRTSTLFDVGGGPPGPPVSAPSGPPSPVRPPPSTPGSPAPGVRPPPTGSHDHDERKNRGKTAQEPHGKRPPTSPWPAVARSVPAGRDARPRLAHAAGAAPEGRDERRAQHGRGQRQQRRDAE